MVVLINVVCNGVDVECTDYHSFGKALLQGVVHACRQGTIIRMIESYETNGSKLSLGKQSLLIRTSQAAVKFEAPHFLSV